RFPHRLTHNGVPHEFVVRIDPHTGGVTMTWTTRSIPSLQGKVAVVTGANSGLGFASARALARAGAHVLLGARDAAKGRDAASLIAADRPGGSVTPLELDLASLDSVASAAAVVQRAHKAVDVLVNN